MALREDAACVDTAAFERGVTTASTRETLREAAALYRGELLEGVRLDEAHAL